MKERIVSGWNLQRVLYVLLGTGLIIQSVMIHQWVGIFFGAYFAAMGIFAFGCASGQCAAPRSKRTESALPGEVIFEEVKNK